jgi:exopolysaccharide biosynthesis predicted pyruvyltransferase EpsI
MKQVKMTFNVDNEGNILNVENENLFKMKKDAIDQANFLITFSKNLNGWSSTILKGIDYYIEKQHKIHTKEA